MINGGEEKKHDVIAFLRKKPSNYTRRAVKGHTRKG